MPRVLARILRKPSTSRKAFISLNQDPQQIGVGEQMFDDAKPKHRNKQAQGSKGLLAYPTTPTDDLVQIGVFIFGLPHL